MRLAKRWGWLLAVLVCLAGIAVGCGREEASSGGKTPNTAATEEKANLPKQKEAATRTAVSAWGEVEVPVQPKRVALTYHDDIDHFVALGVTPVAVPTYERSGNSNGYLPYLTEAMKGVEKIGNAPSLEAILSADPDLIVAGYHHRDLKEQLNRIAPTLYFEWQVDWRKTHLEMGKALGLEAKAQANIDAFNAETQKTKDALKLVVGNDPVAFIRVRQKQLEVYGASGTGAFPSFILYELLGLTPVEEAPKDNWGAPVSLEHFAGMKAEHIFLYVLENDDDAGLAKELLSNPLYRQVPAIQKNRVYMVQSFPWDRGGPIAFTQGMEQIRKMVAGR